MASFPLKAALAGKVSPLICSVLLLLTFFLGGCATSSGPLFEEMTEDDREETPEEEKKDESSGNGEAGVFITTDPEDADVSVNGFYQGTTPITLEGLEPGEYSVKVTKPGYKPEQWWIKYEEGHYDEYEIALTELTGFISLSLTPSSAAAYLGGEKLAGPLEEVQIGTYRLTVKAFGFRTYTANVTIKEDETTLVNVTLPPAKLEITDTALSKGVFNPENPGTLGSVTLRFEVTKNGFGNVTVFDSGANPVDAYRFPEFTSWEQSFTWDGRGKDGTALPDGTYTLFIEAEDGERKATDKIEVVIDSKRRIMYGSTFNGLGGLLYCPSAEVLPVWSSQVGFSFLGHIQTIEDTPYYRFPMQAALRISPLSSLELLAGVGLKLTSAEKTPISLSFSGKYQFGNWKVFKMAASAKGAFVSNDTEDTQTNYSGFSAGLPLQLSAGPFSFLFCPEFIISPNRVVYVGNESYPSRPVYIWNYYRTGLWLQWKRIGGGLSAAFRMLPYSEGFGIHWPAAAGAEFHFIIPETQVVLVLQGAGEFSPVLGYYLLFGLGVALLN